MSSDSKNSKPKSASSARDNAELDGSLGYVSCHEIRNLWTERIRALDTEIWPLNGRTPGRHELMEFFATTGIALMQRAQANYEQFCRRNPPPPPKTPAQNTQADAEEKARYEARRGKMEAYRK